MTILEIVEKYLKKHGFDGLCNCNFNCDYGCNIEDLGCCDSFHNDCVPGHFKDCDKCDGKNRCEFDYCITQG